ncbi:hypothetical protein M404DRAFT_1005015, partial [Pisolithus tinctorius Marx 270]
LPLGLLPPLPELSLSPGPSKPPAPTPSPAPAPIPPSPPTATAPRRALREMKGTCMEIKKIGGVDLFGGLFLVKGVPF